MKQNGAVVNGHCICMAGLSEVCMLEPFCTNVCKKHLGGFLKLYINGMPATTCKKNVRPAELRHIDFHSSEVDKCKSCIAEPKRRKTTAKSLSKLTLIEPSEANELRITHLHKHKVSV